MANNCLYTMKIIGTKENCEKWLELLNNYDIENHFYRIFSTDVYEEETTTDGNTVMCISGDCAWSIESCCRTSGYSRGKDLLAINSKELDLTVEIWTEEYGMGFQEHYIYSHGDCLADECKDANEWYWDGDDYPTYADLKAEYPDAPDEDEFEGPDSFGPVTGGFENYETWSI